MKVAAIITIGVLLILWLRFTRRGWVRDQPAWKPPDRTIYENRSRR